LPPIINAQGVSKAFGSVPLFDAISFTISEGDRIALIGANGSGKSTLLRILAGLESPDTGDLAARKRLRLSYVVQESSFSPGQSVRAVIDDAMERSAVPSAERGTRFAETLGRAGFEDLDAHATSLSGGWQKRLAMV
jgi:ABC transport system ATP-binding/permease protein